MKTRDSRTGKYKHEWAFMGNSKYGDLVQCQIDTCRKWKFGEAKPFSMSMDEYEGMHNRGEIDAGECLGEINNSWLKKPAVHKGIEDCPH